MLLGRSRTWSFIRRHGDNGRAETIATLATTHVRIGPDADLGRQRRSGFSSIEPISKAAPPSDSVMAYSHDTNGTLCGMTRETCLRVLP